MRYALAFVLFLIPTVVLAYNPIYHPSKYGFSEAVIFDDIPGNDFFILYYTGSIEYNTIGGCGTASSPCFGLAQGGELYRWNESSRSFDLEQSGQYFDNQIPSDTSSFQATSAIRIDNEVTQVFPFNTEYRYLIDLGELEPYREVIANTAIIIAGYLILFGALLIIPRWVKRQLKGGEIV